MIHEESPPMTVERFELTHEISLYVHEKNSEVDRGREQIASINVSVSAVVADAILYQVHKALAADHDSSGLILPLIIPKEEEE